MRGLEARVLMAKHRIRLVSGLNADDEILMACEYAREQGWNDASADIDTPPAMFRDEPHLLRAWNDGQNQYDDLLEMQACEGCQNAHGDPCPHHG